MQKEQFEILLEKMEGNFQLAFEKFDLVDSRLDRLESGQETMKADLKDIEPAVGLLHSIANDHESRPSDGGDCPARSSGRSFLSRSGSRA